MKRRDFLKGSAALAGAATLATAGPARAQSTPEVIRVGHLVGICMSPLFYADAMGYFKDEGLKVELKFMPNPGDALDRARRAAPCTSSTCRSPTSIVAAVQRRAGAHHRRQRRRRACS